MACQAIGTGQVGLRGRSILGAFVRLVTGEISGMGIWHGGQAAPELCTAGGCCVQPCWKGNTHCPSKQARVQPAGPIMERFLILQGANLAGVFSPRGRSAHPGWHTGQATARRAAALPLPPALPQSAGQAGCRKAGSWNGCNTAQGARAASQLHSHCPMAWPMPALPPPPTLLCTPRPTCAAGDELNLRTNSASSSSFDSCSKEWECAR